MEGKGEGGEIVLAHSPAEIPVATNGKLIYIKKYAIKHIFEDFFVRGNEQRLYFCVVLDETREKEKV